MAIKYKIKCYKCKKNYVPVASSRQIYVLCYDCQAPHLKQEIEDEQMKAFFDVEHELYKQSPVLRSIKINYLKNEQLSQKEMQLFEKTVNELKNIE